jgi:hypothetical protein
MSDPRARLFPPESRAMKSQIRIVAALGVLVIVAALAGTAGAGSARAETHATIAAALSPYRLGARAQLTFTIHFAGGERGVPSPVVRSVLKFPAGLNLDIPNLRSCSPARLQARGVHGCPAQSRIGSGHAVVEGYLGSQLTMENVTLWVFLGPLRNLQATVEIFGEGYAPLGEQMVLTANGLSEPAPYGEGLELSIPPIPTVPPGSNASILTFTLAIGASGHRNANANTVLIPSRCPAGGFPFAAEFTYADGSSGRALATVPCPR